MLYLGWKAKTKGRGGLYIRLRDIDLITGMRVLNDSHPDIITPKKTMRDLPSRLWGVLF